MPTFEERAARNSRYDYNELRRIHREYSRLPDHNVVISADPVASNLLRRTSSEESDEIDNIVAGISDEESSAETSAAQAGPPVIGHALISDLRENMQRRRQEYLQLREEYQEIEREERRANHLTIEEFKS